MDRFTGACDGPHYYPSTVSMDRYTGEPPQAHEMEWLQLINGSAIIFRQSGQEWIVDWSGPCLTVEDIALALSQINRYSGNSLFPVSVARHSVAMASEVIDSDPELAMACLAHDAHEIVLTDIPGPLRNVLWATEASRVFLKTIEQKVDRVLYGRFGLRYPLTVPLKERLKTLDMRSRAAEREDAMASGYPWGMLKGYTRLEYEFRPSTPQLDRLDYMAMFYRCLNQENPTHPLPPLAGLDVF